MQISKISSEDYDAVLALNEESIPHVNRIPREQLQWFVDNAAYARVARVDGRVAGFLIGLRPGTDYESLNYRWFCDRYDDFAYVDRVAVAGWARRQGIAVTLYDDFANSQPSARFMTCEVNIRPSNEGSMTFHRTLGFDQVGTQELDDGKKAVALLEKRL